jgi:TPR repeat protein
MSNNPKKPSFNSEEDMWAYIEEQETILNQFEGIFSESRKKLHEGISQAPVSFKETERLAAQGDPISQYNLSIAYSKGDGVKADADKAAQWLLRAAENGFAPAQYNVGCYCRDNKDTDTGFEWLMKAAKQNFGPAQFNLGVLHGNAADHSRAFVWFSLAAQNGVEQATANRDKAAGFLSKEDLDAARLVLSAMMMDLKRK